MSMVRSRHQHRGVPTILTFRLLIILHVVVVVRMNEDGDGCRNHVHSKSKRGISEQQAAAQQQFMTGNPHPISINPQTVRHPELHPGRPLELHNIRDSLFDARRQHEDGKPHIPLPDLVPPHMRAYYPYLPIPIPNLPDDEQPLEEGSPTISNDVFNNAPSYRSIINNRGGVTGGFHIPFSGMRREDRQRWGHGVIGDGLYGDRLFEPHKTLQAEGDETMVVSGKLRPCGSDCEHDEFLCVGSCMCIPIEFRCDGKTDCTGRQDELECGEPAPDSELQCLEARGDFRCPRSGKCIRKTWLCDGDDDCGDFLDETHCNDRNCTESEFECNNGFCIDCSWVCDGDNDCKDNSDEMNCTKRLSCEEGEFQCGDGNCISLQWKCDGETDCSDNSDEVACPDEPHVCTESEFECTSSRCIRQKFRCDGDDDCGDGSDEDSCPPIESSCGIHEFSCTNGRCISGRWLCDGESDCEGGEDEVNCQPKPNRTCLNEEFVCDNGNCILKSWVCDNIHDCIHGEDEKDCVQRCEEFQFDCAAHQPKAMERHKSGNQTHHPQINCINMKHVCDGKRDCLLGEDELNCPVPRQCEANSKCQQDCVLLADGKKACSCRPGFSLAADGMRCVDVDECLFESEPVCSHLCTNNIGSFSCSCIKGYVLRPDGRTCKALGAIPTLLFANRVDIRQLSLNNKKYTAIMKGLDNAIALDFDYRRKLIFWSDVSKDVIMRAGINGSDKEVVVKWGLETPGGVAVDWVHSLLFWTDAGTRRVEVATLSGLYRFVVAAHDLDKPRAIAVHPGKGLAFWTDWGPTPKIERADMDGGNRVGIVKESLAWPNGLTIDYATERLFWADAKHHVIESSMFDGSDRKKVISKGLPHPFALTVFEDSLFWTDWHTKSIATASKDSGIGYKVLHAGLHFPMDIHSYHPQRQPEFTNHCGDKNGGCSHLCLPTREAFRCVCPLGMELKTNGKHCIAAEKMLFFARKKDIRLEAIRTDPEPVDMILPLEGILSADAIALDYERQFVYWSDLERNTISRSKVNGSEQETLVINNLLAPTSLAIDWRALKLYWVDRVAKRIEVSNFDGSMRALLIWDGLPSPNDIALNPLEGHMYWTDWAASNDDEPRIFKAGMDATHMRKLPVRALSRPIGLVADEEGDRLYWADGDRIMHANFGGKDVKVLKVPGLTMMEPNALSLDGSRLFWTDVKAKAIYSVEKISGQNLNLVRKNVTGLTSIAVYRRRSIKIHSPCDANNGGCSHLCLISPITPGYACACPIGIKLLTDKRTCSSGPTNSLIVAHRVDIRRISLDVPYLFDDVMPLPPMKNTVGVDVDLKTGILYWTDTAEDLIRRCSPEGNDVQDVIVDGLKAAGGIAIDSTGRKIYWTDDGRDSIEVAELNGSNRKVLILQGLDRPRALALHYHLGFMFWSDWGEKARIERADMDGNNRKVLISKDLTWPNGLAIDRPAGRIYWNDGHNKVIESATLEGNDRRIVISKVAHPYGLVIVGSHVYWTDWYTEGVHKADKRTGRDNQMIISNLTGPMDIRSVQVENVAENSCGNNNGGCSHLCLRSPKGFTCACPSGIILQSDGKTCGKTPDEFLLFAQRRSLARVSLDVPEYWDVVLPIPEVHVAMAIDFHWNKRKIFYSDINHRIIRSINMDNESDYQEIITENVTAADGLAIDWLADNLYWSDAGRRVLEVSRLDGSCRKVIVSADLGEPRAIAVFPRRGYLFWADWMVSHAKIERSMLDGSSRKAIVTADLGFPNGLTLDYSTKKLYWADALNDRIEMCDLNGQGRIQLVPKAEHPFGLTQIGNYIYWTDWFSKSIVRADKTTGLSQITIRSKLDGVMEIRAVSQTRQVGSSPCQVNNGGCSHLCLLKVKAYVCACPDVPDGRQCIPDDRPTIEKTGVREEDESASVAGDAGGGIRSPLDMIHGFDFDSAVEQDKTAPEKFSSRGVVLVISTIVALATIFTVCISIFYYFSCRRKEQKNLLFSGSQNVLVFSNPNYSTHSETGPDKKSSLWKKLKYDKSQERVFGMTDERPEALGLIAETPPTPPARFDSINLVLA